MLLDPFDNAGKMLVLLPDVVSLGQVDEIDARLSRQEKEGVDGLDLRKDQYLRRHNVFVVE